MSFYSDMADTATGMLSEFGQAVTIVNSSSVYDTSTGAATVTTTTQSGIGAIFDYGNKAIDQSLIKVGDKQLLLSVKGITKPSIGDTVNGYSITMVKEINPAGTPVMYECNLRGG